ncbi:MAG: hypothetical protein ACYC9I_10885 [Desulfuromonadales bacterium]|jgi:hypothetical protein
MPDKDLRQRLPIKIHLRKVGQMQLYFAAPGLDAHGTLKEGAIYLEMARAFEGGDGNQCDWANKLVFKLSAHELSEIIVRCRKSRFPVDLVHTHHEETASLKIEPGTVGKDGSQTYAWTLSKGKQPIRLFCKEADMHLIFTCFEAAIPALLGWVWRDTVRLTVDSLQPSRAPAVSDAMEHDQ